MAKEKIDYRLGLDLGTNSIGWAIYSIDKENRPENLIDMGVRIFSDGRNPKTKEPLAVKRRTARGARKLIYRRKLRRKATFRLLQEQGLFPKTKEEAAKLKTLNPYELRVKALEEKLEPTELARILFNLSVRRGFKSNRKDGSREETKTENSKSEKLTQADMQGNLQNAIKNSDCRTLGEFLWKNKEKNGGLRFVPNRMNYYPLRQMYIDEFNAIKSIQEKFYPNIDWQKIHNSIFDQKKLEPPERGWCQYMSDKKRTWKAMPCSEKVRILQEVRNLNYTDENGKTFPISEAQEKLILNLLYTKDAVKFDAMRKALDLDKNCTFNLERNRTELKGSPTSVKMRNEKRFGKLWDSLSLEKQDEIVEKLFKAEEDSEILDMLSEFDLTDEQKNTIADPNLRLVPGTAMLCREVSEQIVHKMEMPEMQITYTTAVQMLGYKYADQSTEKFDELPYYGKALIGSTMGGDLSKPEDQPELKYGKIANPTVHVALNQTRIVVNALIKEYGKPTQIVVELSRDLKASREAKADMIKRQNENAKNNKKLNKAISDAYKDIPYPSRECRLKYRLWEELNADNALRRFCLYCGKKIEGYELFSNNIEIEHILPFGRTLCDAESNKTVAHASCNAFKGERSPFEAFGSNPKGYNWSEILQRANALKNHAKRARFAENAMETFEKESSFIQRQLTDNAYLSKSATRYLKCVCDDVWTVSGGMTKLLRDKWKIDSILKRKIGVEEIAHFGLKDEQIGTYKKNRYDHRHHALDAAVIALIDRSMVQEISRLNKIHKKNKIEVPPLPILHSELVEKVKNIIPSHKPDHGTQGKLSKETLLGKIKRDGKEVFVARCPVSSLSEKNISEIVDVTIQKKLNDFIAANKGKKFEEILQEFSQQTGIKKVRCVNRVQTPIEIKGDVPRYLAPEDYFAAIVWEIPPKKEGAKPTYEAQYIRRDQVDLEGKPKDLQKPHPAAKNLGTVHKGDYLEFSDNGKWYKARVAGLNAANKFFDIRPIYAVDFCNNWIISTSENMLDGCSLWLTKNNIPKAHQNFITVNALFSEKQARFITVNPIGKVFRKK